MAAASDYFFDRTWKSVLWSFALAAIPIERSRVNRRSADTAAEVIEDGWNLVIFPEGGRSPDGWTQPFRGGAAYLARRTGRPVVPVYLHGTRHVLPKAAESGAKAPGGSGTESRRGGRLRRSPIAVLFGAPMTPDEGESAHRFSDRVESGGGHAGPRGPVGLVAGPAFGQRRGARRGGRDRPPGPVGLRLAPGVGARRTTVTPRQLRSGRTDRALSTDPGVVRGTAPGHQPATTP